MKSYECSSRGSIVAGLALAGVALVGCGAPQVSTSRSIAASTASCRAAIASLGRIVDSFTLEISDRQGMLSRAEGSRLAAHMDVGIREMEQACRGVDMASSDDPILPALVDLHRSIRKLETLVTNPSAGLRGTDEYK